MICSCLPFFSDSAARGPCVKTLPIFRRVRGETLRRIESMYPTVAATKMPSYKFQKVAASKTKPWRGDIMSLLRSSLFHALFVIYNTIIPSGFVLLKCFYQIVEGIHWYLEEIPMRLVFWLFYKSLNKTLKRWCNTTPSEFSVSRLFVIDNSIIPWYLFLTCFWSFNQAKAEILLLVEKPQSEGVFYFWFVVSFVSLKLCE